MEVQESTTKAAIGEFAMKSFAMVLMGVLAGLVIMMVAAPADTCAHFTKSVHFGYTFVHQFFMTTRFIGIKEFRQNMSKLSKQAKSKKVRFIVMSHSVPLFEVKPIIDREELEDELLLEKFGKQIEESLEQARRGEVYTLEEVMKEIRNGKKR